MGLLEKFGPLGVTDRSDRAAVRRPGAEFLLLTTRPWPHQKSWQAAGNSIEAMTFVPGQSGNPGGKHGEKLFRNALLAALKRVDGDAERIQRVADRLVENALRGETAAIREIADRIDGRVPQPLRGDDDEKLIIEIRSFPPFETPDSMPAARSAPVIEHQPVGPVSAADEIVELPPFLGSPKPQK